MDLPSEIILQNWKYSSSFNNYVDALNETHITMHILVTNCKLYKNQKSYLLQNIFVVYNFNIKFTYRLVRWEKSAYDGQILNNAIKIKWFQISVSKDCLGNVGYSNSDYLLVSYKGI